MKKTCLFALFSLVLAFVACTGEKARELPTFSTITVTPAKEVYALGDSVQCSITMLTPGDASLKEAKYWFYTSWWGSDPNMTADFCTPDVRPTRWMALSLSPQVRLPLPKPAKCVSISGEGLNTPTGIINRFRFLLHYTFNN